MHKLARIGSNERIIRYLSENTDEWKLDLHSEITDDRPNDGHDGNFSATIRLEDHTLMEDLTINYDSGSLSVGCRLRYKEMKRFHEFVCEVMETMNRMESQYNSTPVDSPTVGPSTVK